MFTREHVLANSPVSLSPSLVFGPHARERLQSWGRLLCFSARTCHATAASSFFWARQLGGPSGLTLPQMEPILPASGLFTFPVSTGPCLCVLFTQPLSSRICSTTGPPIRPTSHVPRPPSPVPEKQGSLAHAPSPLSLAPSSRRPGRHPCRWPAPRGQSSGPCTPGLRAACLLPAFLPAEGHRLRDRPPGLGDESRTWTSAPPLRFLTSDTGRTVTAVTAPGRSRHTINTQLSRSMCCEHRVGSACFLSALGPHTLGTDVPSRTWLPETSPFPSQNSGRKSQVPGSPCPAVGME